MTAEVKYHGMCRGVDRKGGGGGLERGVGVGLRKGVIGRGGMVGEEDRTMEIGVAITA